MKLNAVKCLLIFMLYHSEARHPKSYSEMPSSCKQHFSDKSILERDFSLARQEIMFLSARHASPSTTFHFPLFGGKLYVIDKKAVVYALIFKCGSESISHALLKKDRDYVSGFNYDFEHRRYHTKSAMILKEKANLINGQFHAITFVREPLSHFISGLVESHYRRVLDTDRMLNFSDVSTINRHTVRLDKVKKILNAVLLGRDVSKFLAQPNHFSVQSYGLLEWEVGFIGYLENFSEDWKKMNNFLNTSIEVPLRDLQHPTSKDPFQFKKTLDKLFEKDPSYLRAVCRLIMVDYLCLGYDLPAECSDMR